MSDPAGTGAQREQRLVETFVDLADTMVAEFDVVEFMTMLTGRIVDLGLAHESGVMLADVTGRLHVIAASNERTHLLELFQIQNAEGPCYDCYTTGAPVVIDDLSAHRDRWPQFAPRAIEVGFASVRAVPLRLRDDQIGALNLFQTEVGGLDPGDQRTIRAMADIATIGLLQERNLRESEVTVSQLQHALDSRITIEQAKGVVAEQRDLDMDDALDLLRHHAQRVNRRLTHVADDVAARRLDVGALGP